MAAANMMPSLLDTEARIIEENATHAVVAIRIPKATLQRFIQRNLPFLVAMAELAPSIAPARFEDY